MRMCERVTSRFSSHIAHGHCTPKPAYTHTDTHARTHIRAHAYREGGHDPDYHTIACVTNLTELLTCALRGWHEGHGNDSRAQGHGKNPSPALRGLDYLVTQIRSRPKGPRDAGTVMLGLVASSKPSTPNVEGEGESEGEEEGDGKGTPQVAAADTAVDAEPEGSSPPVREDSEREMGMALPPI